MELEINKELVMSTGHITEDQNHDLFETEGYPSGPLVHHYEEGWRIYVPPVSDLDPEGMDSYRFLDPFIKLAREHGCKWLVFDQDGPTLEEYPTYEW